MVRFTSVNSNPFIVVNKYTRRGLCICVQQRQNAISVSRFNQYLIIKFISATST